MGTVPYDNSIKESLEYLGLELSQKPSASFSESKLGLKTFSKGKYVIIQSVYPGSPTELAGLSIGDEIIAINGMALNSDLDKWLTYFESDSKILSISRNGFVQQRKLTENHQIFYRNFEVNKIKKATGDQFKNLKSWGENGIIAKEFC
jgi:predicted metalloprotease with PDZ domain